MSRGPDSPNQWAGANDPPQGIPRNKPYWEAMYGNLGMGGQFFKGGK